MYEIKVTQIDWDGKGGERVSSRYAQNDIQLETKLICIAKAYNMIGGKIKVELSGEDITERVTRISIR